MGSLIGLHFSFFSKSVAGRGIEVKLGASEKYSALLSYVACVVVFVFVYSNDEIT